MLWDLLEARRRRGRERAVLMKVAGRRGLCSAVAGLVNHDAWWQGRSAPLHKMDDESGQYDILHSRYGGEEGLTNFVLLSNPFLLALLVPLVAALSLEDPREVSTSRTAGLREVFGPHAGSAEGERNGGLVVEHGRTCA
jgi:hypothetical protein